MREIEVVYDRRSFKARFWGESSEEQVRASGVGVSPGEMARLLVEFAGGRPEDGSPVKEDSEAKGGAAPFVARQEAA